ncbi:hypothetical protein Tco_0680765 [Tanacetum coccineum]|uniref:Xylulose kinase-1 n=1 Tax=Tanacetum coccineum TaxID=301880 RepID=A0ABQ4XME0_9ASTR
MVAFLTKTEGNDDFADIVDFLNASSIRYSLTVNPTVYVSNIKQFWSTAKTKTANNETQIYAKVAGKSVVVTESSVRSDLQFNDEDGATCLTNVEIFENLALMGYERDSDKLSFEKALFSPHWKYLIHTILHCLSSKSTAWNEFSTNVASAVICLAKGQKVLDLEKAMTAQAKEIVILKKRVKKLEKRKRSRTQGFNVVRDEGITHIEGDAEQVVIAAAEVVNAGVSVSTAEPKTPPTTTTTTLLKDDELDDERAGLEEAMRLQAEQEAEHAEQIHLDHLLAQRMQDEQEMTEQPKKRQAEVLESARYYTEEDWDIIRANIESNTELSKILLGENEPGEDFATRMVNLLNQRKKFFAEQRAQARRNRPMTQTQQRTYMSTYLKHQGSWTFAQLKKLSDEEIKAKYERLVRSIANFVPMGAEVKEVPVTEELVKEPTAPKQEEIEQPIKKSGRQKSMARKRKLGQSTAKEDEEYEKEKKELSLFLIIAFDEHKEVD